MEEITLAIDNCSQCSAALNNNQKFCVSCGFPEKGTEREKSMYHAKIVMDKRLTHDSKKRIKSARNSLFVVSGISLVTGLYYYFVLDDLASLIASGILALVYLFLGYWSQQKPLVALLLGLMVFLLVIVLNGILDPSTLYKGILIRLFIIVFLVKGIHSAMQLRNSTNRDAY